MSTRLTVDRFEGEGKAIAVLLTEGGDPLEFPKALLPKGTRPGDVLNFVIEKDAGATRAVADATGKVQDELAKGDDGGDIKL
ncbi:DUF3006 domain-containing protein [Isosphaeraceae bacterium EP7]